MKKEAWIEGLREEFTAETDLSWLNSQGEPDIDYVEWLEALLFGVAEEVQAIKNTFAGEKK